MQHKALGPAEHPLEGHQEVATEALKEADLQPRSGSVVDRSHHNDHEQDDKGNLPAQNHVQHAFHRRSSPSTAGLIAPLPQHDALQDIEVLEGLSSSFHHRGQGAFADMYRHAGLPDQKLIKALEERSSPSQHNAPIHD